MIDLESILSRYKPTEEENREIKAIADQIIERTEDAIKKLNVRAKAVLVGSVAKGTNLASGDLDIFAVFSKSYTRHDLEKLGLKLGHMVIPDGTEKYAEHPYVSGYLGERKIDIVPCFEIAKNTHIISSVDRTPLHTEYVLNKLDAKGRDEVRLLKLFMKAIGVYGSEIKVSGFSGYVCELLIIKYGTMLNVLDAFKKTRGRMKISFGEGDTESFDSPVVIIDPTDSTRNAAAAISLENLSRMKINSRLFLNSPHEKYFDQGGKYSPEPYRSRGTAMRIFILPKPDLIDDILFSQAARFRAILVQILEEEGFYPMSSELEVTDRIEVMVECKLSELPGTRIHVGPPVDAGNSAAFMEKWGGENSNLGPYVCGDRLCADIPVTLRHIDEVVEERINGFSIGKNIDSLKSQMEIINPADSNEKFAVLGKFYSKSLV